MSPMLLPWKKRSSEVVLQTPYFRVRRDVCELPDHSVIDDYFVVERSDVAGVVALTPQNEIFLNVQYKHGIGNIVREIPAGIVDEGETPEEAAQRELEEETGWHANNLQFLSAMITSATNESNYFYVYIARNVEETGKKVHHDAREIIVNERIPVSEIPSLIRRGDITGISTLAALYLASVHIPELRL